MEIKSKKLPYKRRNNGIHIYGNIEKYMMLGEGGWRLSKIFKKHGNPRRITTNVGIPQTSGKEQRLDSRNMLVVTIGIFKYMHYSSRSSVKSFFIISFW